MITPTRTGLTLAASTLCAALALTSCAGLTERPAPRTTVVTVTRGQEPPADNQAADDARAGSAPAQEEKAAEKPQQPEATAAVKARTPQYGWPLRLGTTIQPQPDAPQLEDIVGKYTFKEVNADDYTLGDKHWVFADSTRQVACQSGFVSGDMSGKSYVSCQHIPDPGRKWTIMRPEDLCGIYPNEADGAVQVIDTDAGFCLTGIQGWDLPQYLERLDPPRTVDDIKTLEPGKQVMLPNGISFSSTKEGLYFGGGAIMGGVGPDLVYLPIYDG